MYQPGNISYISQFDFVLLTETFATQFPCNCFPSHDVFLSPGVRLSSSVTSRLSGGVAMLIRKSCAPFVKQIHVEIDNCLVFKLSKSLTGLITDCLLIGMYIPPSQSAYYSETEIDNGLLLLEQCICDVVEEYGELPMMIFGDLNARTGNNNAKQLSLPDFGTGISRSEELAEEDISFYRVSKDAVVNSFGRSLLSLCESFELIILNGLLPGDEHGEYTYIGHNGSSIIDYFIVSSCIFPLASRLHVVAKVDSKHMPVELILHLNTQNDEHDGKGKPLKSKITKYVWNQDRLHEYVSAFFSEDVSLVLKQAFDLIDSDIDMALAKLYEVILKAGCCMQKTITVSDERHNKWFDHECWERRREVRQLLRQYRNESDVQKAEERHLSYSEHRRQYKQLLVDKQSSHKKLILNELEESAHDSQKFWGTIKSISRKSSVKPSIGIDEWRSHFSKVFRSDEGLDVSDDVLSDVDLVNGDGYTTDAFDHALDSDITSSEVQRAIKSLKNNKAAGPDGIPGEFYKNAPPCVVNFLTVYFNRLFASGSFPVAWCKSIIHPLHKSGDVNIPDNHRGISLLNISGKLYSYILNQRLTSWVEENGLISEVQAGFRKGYSTIDHIFTLLSLVQKQLLNHGKLYCAFIDFKKAFDSINRSRLWYVLKKRGLSGRMFRAIKSMYAVVKARVRVGADLTEDFVCPFGLK